MSVTGHEILVGISGGIAAYKTAELVSKLVQEGAGVSVVMTETASRFIGRTTFEALTGRPVHTGMFDPSEHYVGEHIGLPRRANLIVIAPATADLLARLAHGHADDLLSTLCLAASCPVLLAPSMNTVMWSKPAVQRNVDQLRADGYLFAEPESGWLSCREQGSGRMCNVNDLFDTIARLL